MHSINQPKLLTNITRLVASLWMSSNQIWERGDPLASLANLSATQFPLRFTWEKAKDLKLDISWRESSIKWPKGTRQTSSELRDLIIVSASLITTPRPGAAMSWKMAPSKLALNHRQGGGDQWTKEGGCIKYDGKSWASWNSGNLSIISAWILEYSKDGESSQAAFRLYHMLQEIKAKRYANCRTWALRIPMKRSRKLTKCSDICDLQNSSTSQ